MSCANGYTCFFFCDVCDLCILASNHKIVGISTLSRKEHATAQTRELDCTKIVLPQVVERGTCIYIIIVRGRAVLLCLVCLTLLASFFLPSHLSFKNMHMYFCIHVHVCVHVVYFYMCIYVLFMDACIL